MLPHHAVEVLVHIVNCRFQLLPETLCLQLKSHCGELSSGQRTHEE